jgi:hypothetical protein
VKSIDGIAETTFDHICVNSEKDPVSSVVSPLSNMARAGKSATLLLGCASSRSCFYELVCACAGQLIQQPAAGRSVTISWFTIGADGSEVLTDELHRASAKSAPEAVGKAPELHLRELGNGKGMLIPGLWEIECASEADVRAVIQHVQARLPHLAAAGSRDSQHHSVFQVTYGDRKNDGAGKKAAGAKKNFVAMGALTDRAAVGRVTLIQLGALVPQPAVHSDEHGAQPSPKKGDVHAHDSAVTTLHPWVHHLKTVMTLLENRQASTPFHRCRLVLLLKDILLRRQSGAVVLSLQQAGSGHSTDTEWLQLFAQLNRLTICKAPTQPPVAVPKESASAAAPRARSRLNSASSAASPGDAARAAVSATAEEDGRSRSAGRAGGPRLFRSSSVHLAGIGAEVAMASEEVKATSDTKPKRWAYSFSIRSAVCRLNSAHHQFP